MNLVTGYWVLLVSFGLVFCSVFLRGIQHKNIIHDRVLGAFIMSGFIYAFDGTIIFIIATSQDFKVVAINAVAAAAGMATSMVVYNRFLKKE